MALKSKKKCLKVSLVLGADCRLGAGVLRVVAGAGCRMSLRADGVSQGQRWLGSGVAMGFGQSRPRRKALALARAHSPQQMRVRANVCALGLTW